MFGSTAVGVDLGTTFSVVGIYKDGKVEIVTDKEKHQIFPSIVSYLDNGGNHLSRSCEWKQQTSFDFV